MHSRYAHCWGQSLTRGDGIGKVMGARCGRIPRGYTWGCHISTLRPYEANGFSSFDF